MLNYFKTCQKKDFRKSEKAHYYSQDCIGKHFLHLLVCVQKSLTRFFEVLHVETFHLFNIKFTYWKLFDVTWNFDFKKWYSNKRKSVYKHNIVVYGWITVQMWFSLPVSMRSLSQHQEGIHGLKPAQACWYLHFYLFIYFC